MQNRYQPTTRIGNWYEDMVLEDEKMREFLEKKAKGTLTIQKIRQSLGVVRLPPPAADGLLHYGAMVRCVNSQLGCYLACDPGDAENVDEEMYSATGSRMADVTARNVWVIRKCDSSGQVLPDDGEVVAWGDEFVLASTDALAPEPFYLASHMCDWSHFSRVSRKQLVYSTQKQSYANIWRIETISTDALMEAEGDGVRIGEPFLLKHVTTNVPLYAAEKTFINDYGSEYELIAGKEKGLKLVWKFEDQ